MPNKKRGEKTKPRYSKLKLAVGAASLFLFIVGVKRSFRPEEPEVTPGEPSDTASGGVAENPSAATVPMPQRESAATP